MHKKRLQGRNLRPWWWTSCCLFVFERLYMEVTWDWLGFFLASSKSNFIKVVLIWNSCCRNSLGLFLLFKFMFLAAVLTTDFFFCLTLFQGFFLLLVPVCLPVCLVQSVHMTNDSNSVSQWRVENLKKIPNDVKHKQQHQDLSFFSYSRMQAKICPKSGAGVPSVSRPPLPLPLPSPAADITADITSSVHVSVCSA